MNPNDFGLLKIIQRFTPSSIYEAEFLTPKPDIFWFGSNYFWIDELQTYFVYNWQLENYLRRCDYWKCYNQKIKKESELYALWPTNSSQALEENKIYHFRFEHYSSKCCEKSECISWHWTDNFPEYAEKKSGGPKESGWSGWAGTSFYFGFHKINQCLFCKADLSQFEPGEATLIEGRNYFVNLLETRKIDLITKNYQK